jgi:phosphoglycolate phosphatase
MTHVLLFDIDGTLLLTAGAGGAALTLAMKELYGLTELAQVDLHGRTDRNIAGQLFEKHGIENSDENWGQLKEAYLANLQKKLASFDGCVLPGIEKLLAELAPKDGVHLGLLTGNCKEGAALKLGHYGLDHYFHFGGFGDEHASRDDVARLALAESGRHLAQELHAHKVWIIGDTIHDISCGTAIGGSVAAVATGGNSLEELEAAQPDLVFESLEDYRPLLAAMDLQ